MRLNLFREFKKDLNIAVSNEIVKAGSKNGIGKIILFGVFFTTYILSKPFYNYYKGRLERKYKIKELKKNGEYVL
jgi:hypothetical protein